MSYHVDVTNMDRVRWILFFDVLPRFAWSRPASVNELYAGILRYVTVSFREFLNILREFEHRNIVKIIKKENDVLVYLTEDAKYFLIVYRPHGV